jgi:hypothetical protein
MDHEELSRLRATICALIEKSKKLRLELEERLAHLDRVRIAMRRMQRSLRHSKVN